MLTFWQNKLINVYFLSKVNTFCLDAKAIFCLKYHIQRECFVQSFLRQLKEYSFLAWHESSMSLLKVFNSCATMRFGCPQHWRCDLDWPKRLFVGKTERITKSLFQGSTVLVFVAVETIIQHNGWSQSYQSGHPHSLPHYSSFSKSSFSTNYSGRHQMHISRNTWVCVRSLRAPAYILWKCEKSPS